MSPKEPVDEIPLDFTSLRSPHRYFVEAYLLTRVKLRTRTYVKVFNGAVLDQLEIVRNT